MSADCEPVLPLIHAEIVEIAERAAKLAIFIYQGESDDEYVIRSAINQTLLDVWMDDPDVIKHLAGEFFKHTRRIVQERTSN